uniref:Uncharacterized protein n=1 Tax=Aegilops tauschii subsp. strangulata TaxID=200361 RepID=A0A453M4E3_AEGTS
KEKLLKKQQREALLLNSYLTFDRFTSGRSHRERKRVTYTFDDYDRSINEALKAIKKSENPVQVVATTNRGVLVPTREASSNGTLAGPSPVCNGRRGESPLKSYSYQGSGGEEKAETLDRLVKEKDLKDTQRTLLRMSRTSTRTLTVMTISWAKLSMTRSILEVENNPRQVLQSTMESFDRKTKRSIL